MTSLTLRASLVGLCLATLAGTALADDDVPVVSDAPDGRVAVQRGIQNPKGLLAVRLSIALNMSADQVGKPISFAPDVYFGVSDKLQLGVVHTGPMHWQTRPGAGLCVTGEDSGCSTPYDNIGLDVMYGLSFKPPFHVSAHGTFYVTSFDASTTMLGLGLYGKYHFSDKASVVFDPQVGLALNKRDLQDDGLFMPVELQLQAADPTTIKLLTGFSASMSAFGDTLQIPVGAGIVQNISEHFDLGMRFSFDNLLGKQQDGVSRADARSLVALLIFRR